MNEISEIFGSFAQHVCISNTNEAILGSCDGHIQHAEVLEDSQAFLVHLLHSQDGQNTAALWDLCTIQAVYMSFAKTVASFLRVPSISARTSSSYESKPWYPDEHKTKW